MRLEVMLLPFIMMGLAILTIFADKWVDKWVDKWQIKPKLA